VRDKRDGPDLAASRRRFLQAAGLAAAGVTSLGAAPGPRAEERRQLGEPVAKPAEDCECDAEPALALRAAALVPAGYFALAPGESGPRLFTLAVDAAGRVSLGSPVDVDVPEDFVVGSLGVSAGRLILTGGLPFVWDAFEANDDVDGIVAESMDDFPEDIPTSGTRRIERFGLRPAAFRVDPPYAEALSLPEMPRRLFAIATEAVETDGGAWLLMVEHSDDLPESWYAAAVDVLEQRGGGWTVQAAGRNLGESGPNHLAVVGDEAVVLLKTSRGTSLVRPGRSARVQAPPPESRILCVLPGEAGFTVLTRDGAGGARMWSPADGAWSDRGSIRLDGDEVVAAVRVAGARGQSVLLGRQAARLVDEASGFAGRPEGR
jgi:hypothetical protein